MRTACAALLLLFTTALPAWAGCGPTAPDARQLKQKLDEVAAELGKVRAAIAAEKERWAKAEGAYRERAKALEQELARLRDARDKAAAEGAERLKHLAELQARLERRLADIKAIQEAAGRARPEAKGRGAEDKLDLILKKLDDLEGRLRKLEGATRRPPAGPSPAR